VNQGWQEIVITGVNLATRWASNTRKPHESKFTQLLTAIIHRTRVPRIRISSLGPEFLDDQFFEIMNDTRFLPHFHVSIQHFNDIVLKKMNRNYDSKTLDRILTALRTLNRDDKEYISIWADLIVWFPWETSQAFEEMIQAIQDYRITKLHAFPFSPHQKWETVPAWAFADQVPTEIKKERMQRILTVGDQVRNEFLAKNNWMTRPVLLEEKKWDHRVWWTPNYIQGSIEGNYKRGDVIPVLIE
jgi:tRNA A37 methylthiotransferase MiaB